MNSYVSDRCDGSNGQARKHARWPWKLPEVDVRLRNLGTTHRGHDRMSPRVAGFGLDRRVVFVLRRSVVVLLG